MPALDDYAFLLANLKSGDKDALGPLCDCIQDVRHETGHAPSLAEVAMMYAGTPPDHADGLKKEALARILEASGHSGNASDVRTFSMGGIAPSQSAYFLVTPEGIGQFYHRDIDVVFREMKRRILCLPCFASLSFPTERAIGKSRWLGCKSRDDVLRIAGFTPNMAGIHYGVENISSTGKVLPHELITVAEEPESQTYRFLQQRRACDLVWPEEGATVNASLANDDERWPRFAEPVKAGMLVGRIPGSRLAGVMRLNRSLVGRAERDVAAGYAGSVETVEGASLRTPYAFKTEVRPLTWVELGASSRREREILFCPCGEGYSRDFYFADGPAANVQIQQVALDPQTGSVTHRFLVGVCSRCRTGYWRSVSS